MANGNMMRNGMQVMEAGKIIGGTVAVLACIVTLLVFASQGSERITKVEGCAEAAKETALEAARVARDNQIDVASIKKDVERIPDIDRKMDALLLRLPEQ